MILNSKGEEIFAAYPTHPGEMVGDELEARKMTQKQLAEQTEVSPTFISELIRGRKSISVLMALKLEEVLKVDASFWLNAQRSYNRDLAYQKAKKELSRLDISESKRQELLKAVAA